MKLKDLLVYKEITIQCHDNPDADAIASGFAVHRYLEDNGITAKIIYGGYNEIQKTNLCYMVEMLNIPIEFVKESGVKFSGLLVTVDCQYGSSNVSRFEADEIAIIDHHQVQCEGIAKTHILSDYGSCATVIWEMMKTEGYDYKRYIDIQTALYYGLYSDTAQFMDITNPVDKDMKDDLVYDQNILRTLQNSNINAKELEIAGVAILRSNINEQLRFAVVKAHDCDPNILGLISDFVLQVSEIDKCLVFCDKPNGIKFSVRSCNKDDQANHIASFVSEGFGNGGGHLTKAGGFIDKKKYEESEFAEYDHNNFFTHQLKKYCKYYDIIDSENYKYDIDGAGLYKKKQLKVGYIRATDILAPGAVALIRTLEGDIHLEISADMYIMIGVKGEVYPISRSVFEKAYTVSEDEKYDLELPYHPKAKIIEKNIEYSLLDYAKVCYSNGGGVVYAKKANKPLKVYTRWDRERYTVGKPGDYLVCRFEDLNDVYIIEEETFGMTYETVD